MSVRNVDSSLAVIYHIYDWQYFELVYFGHFRHMVRDSTNKFMPRTNSCHTRIGVEADEVERSLVLTAFAQI